MIFSAGTAGTILENHLLSKTNAVRILEKSKIDFTIAEYEVDEEALDAVSVANKIKAEIETVFKTLIAQGDKNGINVFVIPGNYELDLKKAAKISGNKKIEMIKMKELLPLTGYIRGGCSPIGMKKTYPTYIDETSQLFNKIYVSGGIRGMQICLKSDDLLNVVSAEYSDLV
ncbi:MAG: Cys-tRNA(Pro) deacylase [Melioribacteraceae bacterium]|nr:Cys-tRNA(Pro) deacylase [Melioribacteraceae bacterium]